jgi:hypothetical protein
VASGWSGLIRSVERLNPAHRVREIGPRTASLGASSSRWQPKTLSASGFWKLVTTAPAPLVKFMTPPDTRP